MNVDRFCRRYQNILPRDMSNQYAAVRSKENVTSIYTPYLLDLQVDGLLVLLVGAGRMPYDSGGSAFPDFVSTVKHAVSSAFFVCVSRWIASARIPGQRHPGGCAAYLFFFLKGEKT